MRKRIGFYLIDGYALMSTAAAMEPLRAANLFSPTRLYDIVPLSANGGPVRSSLTGFLETEAIATQKQPFDLVFVVAGGDPLKHRDTQLDTWLRQVDAQGVSLGGISGGAVILARAGLMNRRRFTVHWHHLDALRALDATYLVERRIFVIDRDRFTCAGGTAPLDMMFALISADHGSSFARKIADWFIQTEIRQATAPQQASIEARYGSLPTSVADAIDLMESHIADPLDLQQVADLVGLSQRQLQRQFTKALGQSVMQHYRCVRLALARELLSRTHLSHSEIAHMTGFNTQATFSTTFTKIFGAPPKSIRQGGTKPSEKGKGE